MCERQQPTVESTESSQGQESSEENLSTQPKPLKVGDSVKINFSGSKRDGKFATIKRLKSWGKVQLADLAVDGEGFKHWEAQLTWLEKLNA